MEFHQGGQMAKIFFVVDFNRFDRRRNE